MKRQQRRLVQRVASILHAPAQEHTYWNGEPAQCRKVRVIVGSCAKPTFWHNGLEGTEREAVEVTYHGDTFLLDNEGDGSGWAKVTTGRGMWTHGHRSLPDDSRVIEAAAEHTSKETDNG